MRTATTQAATPAAAPAESAGRPLDEAVQALEEAREYTRALLDTAETEVSLNAANASAMLRGSIVAGVLAVHVWLFALVLLAWWVVSLGVGVPAVAGATLAANALALWGVSRHLRRTTERLGFPRTRAVLGLQRHA